MTPWWSNVTESNGELVSCPWLSLQQLQVVQSPPSAWWAGERDTIVWISFLVELTLSGFHYDYSECCLPLLGKIYCIFLPVKKINAFLVHMLKDFQRCPWVRVFFFLLPPLSLLLLTYLCLLDFITLSLSSSFEGSFCSRLIYLSENTSQTREKTTLH